MISLDLVFFLESWIFPISYGKFAVEIKDIWKVYFVVYHLLTDFFHIFHQLSEKNDQILTVFR